MGITTRPFKRVEFLQEKIQPTFLIIAQYVMISVERSAVELGYI